MTQITLQKLRKDYRSLVAVNDLTLKVQDKSLVTLLGPSGCGKTTTLKMIAGLIAPTSGKIYFDDKDVTGLSPQERNIGLVFQDYAIFPTMTAYDNIAFGLKIRKLPKGEINKRIIEVADTLHIRDVLDEQPGKMTQSQMQSVALARTLVTNPTVLLLDEPLSNLDAAFRLRMRAELKRLQKEIKQTVIYVTHDQVEALSISDKIAVMNFGVLHQYGTPSDIYNHPSTYFVAGFIGSPPMNFIDCTFIDKNGGYMDIGVKRIDVSKYADLVMNKGAGVEYKIGARPEDVKVLDKATKKSVPIRVEAYEPLGDEAIVDLSLGETLIRARTPISFLASPGETKYIEFDLDKIHIIDKKTEKVII